MTTNSLLTVDVYSPKMQLPLYTKVASEDFNFLRVGRTYDVAVRDEEDGSKKHEEDSEKNFVHEAMLISMEEYSSIKDIPDIVLAFDQNTRERDKALERLKKYESDNVIWLAVFMRVDVVQDFILKSGDVIDVNGKFDKEDATDQNTNPENPQFPKELRGDN